MAILFTACILHSQIIGNKPNVQQSRGDEAGHGSAVFPTGPRREVGDGQSAQDVQGTQDTGDNTWRVVTELISRARLNKNLLSPHCVVRQGMVDFASLFFLK